MAIDATKDIALLSVLARINPAIFDYIFPHGPAAVAQRMGAGKVREAMSAGADKLMEASLTAGTK